MNFALIVLDPTRACSMMKNEIEEENVPITNELAN
jgi:hypothetical protein